MSSKKKEARAVVDNRQAVLHPLDFSFKAIQDFSDLVRERPRLRDQALAGVVDLENEVGSIGSQASLFHEKFPSTALKVNNNILTSWEGFMEAMGRLFESPATTIGWIDFSFNDLKTIDECLLELPSLTTLYFHGNNITSLAAVDKLSRLPRLKSLTLHGNPIEMNHGYRFHILSRVGQLQTLDFSGVTKADRATCQTWASMIASKPRARTRDDY